MVVASCSSCLERIHVVGSPVNPELRTIISAWSSVPSTHKSLILFAFRIYDALSITGTTALNCCNETISFTAPCWMALLINFLYAGIRSAARWNV